MVFFTGNTRPPIEPVRGSARAIGAVPSPIGGGAPPLPPVPGFLDPESLRPLGEIGENGGGFLLAAGGATSTGTSGVMILEFRSRDDEACLKGAGVARPEGREGAEGRQR